MKSTFITRYFLVFLLSLLTLTVSTTPAGAQTGPATSYAFTVNTTADTHDAHPGDGVCADQNGKCSLRAAIEEADALPSGSSITIMVPADTYGLTLGTLHLTEKRSITIHGAGNTTTIIKGNNTFEILYIGTPMMSAHLSYLTIEGGFGGNGGGIYNRGTLTVTNSTISNNSATSTYGSGGGIHNNGTLTVTHSTISNNSAKGYGGGGIYNNNNGTLTVSTSTISGNSASSIYSSGGGISNRGTLTVTNSTISNNSADGYGGGGIYNNTGTLSVSDSTFSGNSAIGGFGGGIENTGTLSVGKSTFSGNSALFDGGGIDNDGYAGGVLSVSNSTFSSNSAGYGGGGGGGIESSGGTTTVSNSTLSGNSVNSTYGSGGGIKNDSYGRLSVSNSTLSGNSAGYNGGGGIYNYNGSTVTLTGTIVANSPRGGNCYGTISEGAGYNLDSGTSCGFSLRSDLNKTDPMLGPLKNNGGPTQTMALLQGSKAIDWVAASSYPATDQRGYVRPDGSGESTCDIGAYESAY